MNDTKHPTARRGLVGALALIALLVLTACGAKIDTVLSVAADGSGTRTMTLTLDEGFDRLTNGAAGIDESIRRHLPEHVEYSGLNVQEGADGIELITAAFTVSFDSTEDYLTKMAHLMNASDLTWDGESVFRIEETTFVSGLEISETFSSRDILGWLFDGLIADGVVTEEVSSGDLSEIGTTSVDWDGVSHEAGQPIQLSRITDTGFASVEMTTAVGRETSSREIEYTLAEKAMYNSSPDRYDELFRSLEDAGMTVEQDLSQPGVIWRASIADVPASEIEDLTRAALLTDEVGFGVEHSSDGAAPTREVITLSTHASCSAICAQGAPAITDRVTLEDGFSFFEGAGWNDGEAYIIEYGSGVDPVHTFEMYHPIAAVDLHVDRGFLGGYSFTGAFTVSEETDGVVGEALQELLERGDTSVERTESDEGVVYTASFDAADAEEFGTRYSAWSGEPGYVGESPAEGGGFFAEKTATTVSLIAPSALGASLESTPQTHSFSAAFPSSLEESTVYGATAEDGRIVVTGTGSGDYTMNVTVQGITLAALITLGGVALFLLVAGVAALIFRRQIAEGLSGRRERAAQTVAPAGAPVMAGMPAQAPAGAGPVPTAATGLVTPGVVPPGAPGAWPAQQAPARPSDASEADFL